MKNRMPSVYGVPQPLLKPGQSPPQKSPHVSNTVQIVAICQSNNSVMMRDAMEDRAVLLCLAKDRELLAIRARVLATRYKVTAIDSLHQMTELPLSSAFQILVLCHTVSEAECMTALRISKFRWPKIKVVSLTKHGSSPTASVVDASVECLEGPEVLLNTIFRVLPKMECTS